MTTNDLMHHACHPIGRCIYNFFICWYEKSTMLEHLGGFNLCALIL